MTGRTTQADRPADVLVCSPPVGDEEGRVTQLPRHSASPFETLRRQLGRFGWLSYALLVTRPALVVVITLPTGARGASEKLVGRPEAGEFQPVRGNNFIAWQEHATKPTDDVFAWELSGGAALSAPIPRRVNACDRCLVSVDTNLGHRTEVATRITWRAGLSDNRSSQDRRARAIVRRCRHYVALSAEQRELLVR